MVVLRQHDEVIARVVVHALVLVVHRAAGYVHLAAEDRLERRFALLLPAFVDLGAVVRELLDAEHHAVVRDGHAFHPVGHGLVDQPCHLRLSVQDGVVRVDVQMYVIFHWVMRFEA